MPQSLPCILLQGQAGRCLAKEGAATARIGSKEVSPEFGNPNKHPVRRRPPGFPGGPRHRHRVSAGYAARRICGQRRGSGRRVSPASAGCHSDGSPTSGLERRRRSYRHSRRVPPSPHHHADDRGRRWRDSASHAGGRRSLPPEEHGKRRPAGGTCRQKLPPAWPSISARKT
jgi:hypothetical protein